MNKTDVPNVRLPLAASYNTRGQNGISTAVTRTTDQRKINSMYQMINNAATGAASLKLVKRPGTVYNTSTFGLATQYVQLGTQDASQNPVLFTTAASVIPTDVIVKGAGGATSTLIVGSNYLPRYCDRAFITGTETMIVQLVYTDTVRHRIFFGTAAGGPWTEITDANFVTFLNRGKMEFMDGWAFIMTSDNKVINLDLNSLTVMTNTNQFYRKQIEQDVPQGLAKLGNQLLAFGLETMEVFVNGGVATGSPLTPVKQLAQRVGLPSTGYLNGFGSFSTHYYCVIGKKLYFVGSVAADTGVASTAFYVYDGSEVSKVSPPNIDAFLNGQTTYSVSRVNIMGRAAVAIGLSNWQAASAYWLMYFPDVNEWFEWTSSVFQPTNNDAYFLGIGNTASANKLQSFSALDYGSEPYNVWNDGATFGVQGSGTAFQWAHQFKLPADGNERKQHKWAALVGDTARAAQAIDLSVSDDDYQTWTSLGTIDMTSDKKALYRLGGFNQRAIRLSYTGSLGVDLTQFLSRIE